MKTVLSPFKILSFLALLFALTSLSATASAEVFFARFHPEDCATLGVSSRTELLSTPFVDAHDAYLRLYCIEQDFEALPVRDDRIVFLTMYLRTTDAVVSAIEAKEFIDNAWVDVYLTSFANLYRTALLNFEIGNFDQVPRAWRLAFEACLDPDTLITQHLLLGVNAHVNYDLAIALADLDLTAKGRYEDHTAINGILERIVDEQFALVAEKYAHGLGELPLSLDALSKRLFFVNLKVGREGAWKKALLLKNASSPASREFLRRGIDTEGAALAHLGLSPKLSKALMRTLHRVEQGAVD